MTVKLLLPFVGFQKERGPLPRANLTHGIKSAENICELAGMIYQVYHPRMLGRLESQTLSVSVVGWKDVIMQFSKIAEIHAHYSSRTVNAELHPNDAMYRSGASHYFTVGVSGVQAVLTALSLSPLQSVSRVMDLPCGHGRVARHLRALFPSAELFYSDIDVEGAEFCARTFGGTAIPSQPDLLLVDLPRELDVIWIGSLFTHLDRSRTEAWLHYLVDHLSNHGVLLSTFHGYFTEKNTPMHGGVDEERIRQDFAQTGFGYAPYTAYPNMVDYGISISKPSAILEIADNIPGVRASYIERGWANNHDVLILNKRDRLTP